ncbi:Trp operon repressor [Orbus hercynius]|uniref:Trp operon repressor homolog n=1 Tax=Orbus hercynius TaxID=593135 RepID=A0A495REE8_9GAMM|nr:trp operon repressor [Orbus hercynius]RKS85863.1 Trp operon repressor [Orbus hercynius]
MKDDDWQNTVNFLQQAFEDNYQLDLFKLLMTTDERSALITRVKIVKSLLEGSVNQRQLKEQLGIGIATITRGSNSLKDVSPECKAWLEKTLLNK